MSSDSIANASSFPFASSNSRDYSKKKRVNRSAKLKQCKLDARREQWLSQVKNKGSKEEANGGGTREPMLAGKERGKSMEKLEIKSRSEEENEVLMNNYSDSDSPSHSPTSHASSGLGSNDSGMNFTGTSSHSSPSSSSHSRPSSSSSSSSGGCCSEIVSEEDGDGDDDCLDDWETFADALAATDVKQEQHDPNLDLPRKSNENGVRMDSQPEVKKRECEVTVQGATAANFRAWRPDDAFRPQGLPNLSKQFSFPMNTDRHCGRGGTGRGCTVGSPPTSCPICCEDLDLTDTSFLPCLCGFRLCLFCHKRILEEDGRCPGCRKQYDHDSVEGETTLDGGSLTFRLARSCSMGTRS